LATSGGEAYVDALDVFRVERGAAAVEGARPSRDAIAIRVGTAAGGAHAGGPDVQAVTVLAGGATGLAIVPETPSPRHADPPTLRRVFGAVVARALLRERAAHEARVAAVPVLRAGARADPALAVEEADRTGAVVGRGAPRAQRCRAGGAAALVGKPDPPPLHLPAGKTQPVVGPAFLVRTAARRAVALACVVVHHAEARPRPGGGAAPGDA